MRRHNKLYKLFLVCAAVGLGTQLAAQDNGCFGADDLATGIVFETPVVVSDKPLMQVVKRVDEATVLTATYKAYRPNRPTFIVHAHAGLFTIASWEDDSVNDKSFTALSPVPSVSDLREQGDVVSYTAAWESSAGWSFEAERQMEVVEARQVIIDGCQYDALHLRANSDVLRSDGQKSKTSFDYIYMPELQWSAFIPIFEELANVSVRAATANDLRFFAQNSQ